MGFISRPVFCGAIILTAWVRAAEIVNCPECLTNMLHWEPSEQLRAPGAMDWSESRHVPWDWSVDR